MNCCKLNRVIINGEEFFCCPDHSVEGFLWPAAPSEGDDPWAFTEEPTFEVDNRNEALDPEKIDGPAHYGGKDNPYEAIKVIEAHDLGFHLGNAVKYILRAGKKSEATEVEDLEKAKWYLERRITQIENDWPEDLDVSSAELAGKRDPDWFEQMVEFTSPEAHKVRAQAARVSGPLAGWRGDDEGLEPIETEELYDPFWRTIGNRIVEVTIFGVVVVAAVTVMTFMGDWLR